MKVWEQPDIYPLPNRFYLRSWKRGKRNPRPFKDRIGNPRFYPSKFMKQQAYYTGIHAVNIRWGY